MSDVEELVKRLREDQSACQDMRYTAQNALQDEAADMIAHLRAERDEAVAALTTQPIETAPKDFTPILAYAVGVDGRDWVFVARWQCFKHQFSSQHRCSIHLSPDCEFGWSGEMGGRMGVPILGWVPLPNLRSANRTTHNKGEENAN